MASSLAAAGQPFPTPTLLLLDNKTRLLRGLVILLAASALWLAAAGDASAALSVGDRANDFNSLSNLLSAWVTGTLGKSLALVFLITGLILGIARGSIVGALTSIGCAIGLVIIPEIIDALFTGAAG